MNIINVPLPHFSRATTFILAIPPDAVLLGVDDRRGAGALVLALPEASRSEARRVPIERTFAVRGPADVCPRGSSSVGVLARGELIELAAEHTRADRAHVPLSLVVALSLVAFV
ncbi:MAG: hypothetical protein U0270_26990 [Labilithrix sp.]